MFNSLLPLFGRRPRNFAPIYAFGILALLILGPLLVPGFILTLDMSWPPRWEMPREIANGYPLYVLLAILDNLIPSMVLQKLVLWSMFFVSGIGMYYLARHLQRRLGLTPQSAPLYFAGILYTINPFTYARFMDGQWLVLLGYALLPVYVLCMLRYIDSQTARRTVALAAVSTVIIGISLHSTYMLILLSLMPVVLRIYDLRGEPTQLFRFLMLSFGIAVFALGLHSLWLVHSASLGELASFDRRHLLTFRTLGDGALSTPFNVLTLHGYWGEGQDRFLLVKQVAPLWPLYAAMILSLVGLGAARLWKASRRYLAILLVPLFLAWILAVGIATPIFASIYTFAATHLPFFDGYREPQKFVMILALGYALLGSVGAHWLLSRKRLVSYRAVATFLILALPILYAPAILWGGFSQLRAADYPRSWYETDAILAQETPTPVTLFLPWHEYIYLNFAGRTVANPAKRFFHTPIIQADDPGLGLIDSPSTDDDAAYIEAELLDSRKDIRDAGRILAERSVKYIVVSKTADWRKYDFLRRQTDLTLISDTNTLLVYRNNKLR